MNPTFNDINYWLEENQKYFFPPICNKLMHKDGQLKVFFVGGPNSRKDFHLEEGEEFFYMLKGDMKLVVFERNEFRDILIKEGEVFLLPSRIAHSPQRYVDTIGLVIERERTSTELDCLRYYVDSSAEILYEKWFNCTNLEGLGPLIKEFFESEQHKTGRPLPGFLLDDKPFKEDLDRELEKSFPLGEWLEKNKDVIDEKRKMELFKGTYSSRVRVLGKGVHTPDEDLPETFLWQVQGASSVCVESHVYELQMDQTLLIPSCRKYTVRGNENSRLLSIVMNPI